MNTVRVYGCLQCDEEFERSSILGRAYNCPTCQSEAIDVKRIYKEAWEV